MINFKLIIWNFIRHQDLHIKLVNGKVKVKELLQLQFMRRFCGHHSRPLLISHVSAAYLLHVTAEKSSAAEVPELRMSGAKHFHVAGYSTCGYSTRASAAITGLSTLFPTKIKSTIHECTTTQLYLMLLLLIVIVTWIFSL